MRDSTHTHTDTHTQTLSLTHTHPPTLSHIHTLSGSLFHATISLTLVETAPSPPKAFTDAMKVVARHGLNFGQLDCNEKLPSGKTVAER